MKRGLCICVTAALIAGALSGCNTPWHTGYRELEDLEIIRSVCVDTAPQGVLVTVCTGVGPEDAETRIYTAAEKTMGLALDKLEKTPMGKEAVYSHAEHLVVGEEAAKAGIAPYLDYVARTTEMRLDTNLFVVRGDTAQNLMTATAGKRTAATNMLENIESTMGKIGLGCMYSCGDAAAALEQNGCALAVAVEAVPSGERSESGGAQVVEPVGIAVLQDGRLADYVLGTEARGASMLMGDMQEEDVHVETAAGAVVLHMTDAAVHFAPRYENGMLRVVDVEVRVELNVSEVLAGADVTDADVRRGLEEAAEKIYDGRMIAAITHAQQLGADYMGLGSRIERSAPGKFVQIKNRWAEIFPAIIFNVETEAAIERTYDIDRPVTARGEE